MASRYRSLLTPLPFPSLELKNAHRLSDRSTILFLRALRRSVRPLALFLSFFLRNYIEVPQLVSQKNLSDRLSSIVRARYYRSLQKYVEIEKKKFISFQKYRNLLLVHVTIIVVLKTNDYLFLVISLAAMPRQR